MATTKTTRLRVATPQGDAGMLQKESRFVFNYDTTERAREVSLVMPLRADLKNPGYRLRQGE